MRFGPKDLEALFEGASKIHVAKGKKILSFNMAKEPLPAADLAKVALGPSGNLRAPTVRTGKTWVIGFNDEVYGDVFGA